MAVSINDLLAPLVKKDVLADLYTLLGQLIGYPLALQDGEPVPAILDATVGLFVDSFWNPTVLPALRAVYLDYSSGDWLSLIAWLVYNRPRIQAQAATGSLVVENHAAIFAGVIAVGAIRVKNTTTGKTYTNTTSGAVAAYVAGTFPVPPAALNAWQVVLNFEADEAGSGSNSDPSLSPISTTPVSAPSGIYVQTNAAPFLGSDGESDPNLVSRARLAVQSRSSGGPRGAYVDAAKDPVTAFTSRNLPAPASWGAAAPAILRVKVQEPAGSIPWSPNVVFDTIGATRTNAGKLYSVKTPGTAASAGGPSTTGQDITDGTVHWQYIGQVAVWCASASGASGGTSADVNSDVGKANVAIQMFVAPPGVLCTVAPAIEQPFDLGVITIDVSAESRVTSDEATATAATSLAAFFSTLPIGGAKNVADPTRGYVYYTKVAGVITSGPGVVDVTFSLLSPVDTVVSTNAVVVPAYTIAVNIVAQGAL